MRFAICPLQMCKVPHLSREISEANLNYLMLHNATIARRSAPWPPNMFDGDVSCAAPAMRNASLQILSKAEHLLVFESSLFLSLSLSFSLPLSFSFPLFIPMSLYFSVRYLSTYLYVCLPNLTGHLSISLSLFLLISSLSL